MRLVFVDESGDPGRPHIGSKYPIFIITCVIVNEKDWTFLRDEFQKVKIRTGLSPLTEVKWSDCMQPQNISFTPRRQNPLQNLDQAARERFALDTLNLVRRINEVRLVVCEIDKTLAYSRPDITDSSQVYNEATLLTMERIQYFLQAKNSRGIIIQDSRNYQQDQRLRSFYGSLITRGSYWTQFPNIVEGVFLSPSNYAIGLQVADFCAGAVGRASNKVPNPQRQFFSEISHKITSPSRDGVVRGGMKNWP